MADVNVIAGVHPMAAAWKRIFGCQAEAVSLLDLWDRGIDDESWATLAKGVLDRFVQAGDALERAESQQGMPPLTHWQDGGMGAVAPMVTEVVAGQSIPSRT